MAKPKPVPVTVVCSECGLPWADHTRGRKTDPTTDTCVRLLKAELVRRPLTVSAPYVPAPYPVYPPTRPIWSPNTWISAQTATAGNALTSVRSRTDA